MARTSKEDSFSNGLTSSGLSSNHNKLTENIQLIEKLTRLRRVEYLYTSQVLVKSFKYIQEQ
jgi:hypothetical protein